MATLGYGSILNSPSVTVDSAPKDSLQDFFVKIDGISGESKDSKHTRRVCRIFFSSSTRRTRHLHGRDQIIHRLLDEVKPSAADIG